MYENENEQHTRSLCARGPGFESPSHGRPGRNPREDEHIELLRKLEFVR
jgi:hypothetical protein